LVAIRQKRLIELIKSQQGSQTVQYYAEKLNVSVRTIRSDLVAIKPLLYQDGFELLMKPGFGITVIQKEKNTTEGLIKETIDVSPINRTFEIYSRMLFDNEVLTLQELADEYWVSPSSIKSDFQKMEKKFIKKGITAKIVQTRNGSCISGTEEEFQKSMTRFNNEYIKEKSIESNGIKKKLMYLKDFYDEEIVDSCLTIIDFFEESKVEFVAQHYLMNVINALIVMIYCAKLSKHNTTLFNEFIISEKLERVLYYTMAKDVLLELASKCDFEFTDDDTMYLAKILIANRIGFKRTTPKENDISCLAQRVINRMSEFLGVDLSDDEELYHQLVNHINPMIFRLKNDMYVSNPLLDSIKNEFRLLFSLMWQVMDEEAQKFSFNLNEDEISFLIIYFQIAIDKKRSSKRVLIVCPTGVTTSQLVANRVRSVLPPLDIVEVVSMESILKRDLERFDFIISTIQLDISNKPVLKVSPLLDDNDIQNIYEFYKKEFIAQCKLTDNCSFRLLSKYLNYEHSRVISEKRSSNEVLNIMLSSLESAEIIQSEYCKSVFERENMGGTDMITGVAVPHGNFNYVNETCITFSILKNPINWGKYTVKLVIHLNLSTKDIGNAKELMKEVYNLVQSKNRIDKIVAVNDIEQLKKVWRHISD